jgi:hypothetical protein
MASQPQLHLQAYYLNTRRLSALTAVQLPVEAQRPISQNGEARRLGMDQARDLADRLLSSGKIPDLGEVIGAGDPDGKRIIASLWNEFTFRRLSTALRREAEGKPYARASFSGRLELGNRELAVRGVLMNEHVYSGSSDTVLTRKRRLLIAGMFEFQGDEVEVHPYVIGELAEAGEFFDLPYAQSVRIYPQQIDAFSKIADHPRPTAEEIRTVAGMLEDDVKTALADIIQEPFIPKDWGGEKSDFVTSRLKVNGAPVSAAFILKGRSIRGELHPSKMGARGDQLLRAYSEPVDIVVVQHVNKIASSIVDIAERFAYTPRNPRRFCIIDGGDTAHILKAYGKLPAG